MNVTLFGSSTLDIPFAFPNGTIADAMGTMGVSTSNARANALTVLYWDGIDANKIPSLSTGLDAASMAKRKSVLAYLQSQGASLQEASAYISAMITLPDTSWLLPSWSWFKTIVQETTGTGEQGSSGSGGTAQSVLGALPWGTIALFGIGALVLYGVATTATKSVITR